MSDMAAPHAPPRQLVVIGSSAGGIEALSVVLAQLPDGFPAPIVLAQHLDPNRPSQLASILERRIHVPVVLVAGETQLENGTVYVVPSNRDVVIRDGSVLLSDHTDGGPRPSVDRLLTTAAASYGEGLVAVILTGSGSDGAAGALEVKAAGGTVVIQDPRTAAHPSMPLALPPTAVDHVADLERIGPLIAEILAGDGLHAPGGLGPDVLEGVLKRVSRHTYIDFRQYKPSTILRRIGRRMVVNHVRTMEEYEAFLESHPQEVQELARSLLIQVTEFFRDTEAFAFMEREVLPALIEKGRQRGRTLRLWSAGCATGEEAYSLALMVAHALGTELPEWTVKIFATDVAEEAIAYARRGYYAASVVEALPEDRVLGYFEHSDHGYRVSKSLRQMVIFGQQDLSRGAPFPRIDLVVCRNLLIYFKPELQQEVLDLFAYSLHHHRGYLFLGKAEVARPSKSVYEMVNKKWKVYRCTSGPLPLPVRGIREAVQVVRAAPPPAAEGANGDPHPAAGAGTDLAQLRRTNDLMLRHLPVAVAVIDRGYRIVSVNSAARRLLGIREQTPDQDFLHSSRGLPYQEVREAIDRMFREQVTAMVPELDVGPGGIAERRQVSLQVVPLQADGAPTDFAMVCLTDITDLVHTRRRLEEIQLEQKRLSDDLGAMNWRLTVVNKELQDANEELQAGTEEMTLAQEELQATNEEFEATNEELQATNEELETNNEELQATNEELETTNDELQARTLELQDLTRALSGERQRLETIVEHAPLQSALLRGPHLRVEEMHPGLDWLFGDARDTQLPFVELPLEPALEPLRSGVMRSFQENRLWVSPRLRVGPAAPERWFTFTVVPTLATDGGVDGVVVYADDVTERRRLEQEERLGKIRMMLEHADQVALAMFEAPGGRLVHASHRFLERIGLDSAPDEASRLTWKQVWRGDEASRAAFERVVTTGDSERLNEVRMAPDDTVWDISLIPIAADDVGEVRHVVVSGVEVTDAVHGRERLERLDHLKDEFLSLASHELRTPLAPLSAYTEVLSRLLAGTDRGEAWERQLRSIVDSFRRQVQQMSRLTDDLLDVARLQSGKFTLQLRSADLRRIVEDEVERSRVTARVPIELTVESASFPVIADDVRLGQAVRNLVANALTHAPETRQVEVSLARRDHDGAGMAHLEVRDFGAGVPIAVREALFSRFQSAPHAGQPSRTGLGLGLYISRQIVEQHGGAIGVRHEEPGSTFWIELPLAAE